MQLRHALTTVLVALCCADNVLGRNVLRVRQDSSVVTSTTETTTDGSTTSSNTAPTSTRKSTGTVKDNTSTNDGSEKTTKTAVGGGATHVVTTSHPSITPATGGQSTTGSSKDDELPIEPVITPAIGIAGVILLCTGLAYTIIGIKHKWLLVFLSAFYLAILSITVLIIYVMSPPVSNAIQGAYFVAAVVTGLIFGAVSLVFKEITEGFGCIVGGFCIAMWFLVLKPGGLIESTIGKAIMISVFSAVGWSLAFSQYTRTYGTIICTSFGGAMITILGIDCFSRAGLKEFWIYIWALNDKEFPIHTTTYPITRGIRVEIAGTIVLFLFGIMSQIKVWKIVRERKLKNEAVKLEDDKTRELRDSRIGKRVEKNNERSLAQWEAIYGGSKANDASAAGTSEDSDPKKVTSVVERELGSIEMDDMSSPTGTRNSNDFRTSGVEAVREQQPTRAPKLSMDVESGDCGWWADFRSSKAQSKTQSRPSADQSSLVEIVPSLKPGQYDSLEETVHGRRGIPIDRLGLEEFNEEAQGALPRIEDDRASSVAATLDDEADLDPKRLSVALSNFQLEVDKGGLSPFSDGFKLDSKPHSPARTPDERPVLEDDDEEVLRPLTADAEAGAHRSRRKPSKRHSRKSSTGSYKQLDDGDDEGDESEPEKAPSVHSLKERNLPGSISKVAMAYRTNEWAKHIANANQPDIEEEVENDVEEPSVQVEYYRPAKEQPKSVDTAALLETGTLPPKRPRVESNPYRRSSKESRGQRSSSNPTPVYAFQRTTANPSLQRQGSYTSTQQPRRERQSSQPMYHQTLLESPIEETQSSHYSTPLGSTMNLLDDRNSRLKKRLTTTSFNVLNTPTSETPPISEAGISDDLPLSQRKELLLEQGVVSPTSPPQTQNRRATNPNLSRTPSYNQNAIYDSHQPRRSNPVDTRKQSAMLSQWRSSLQHESSTNPVFQSEEHARMQMLMQQRLVEHQARKNDREKEWRDEARDVAMRTSWLTNAHQDALRKMQAKANDSAAGKRSVTQ